MVASNVVADKCIWIHNFQVRQFDEDLHALGRKNLDVLSVGGVIALWRGGYELTV